jgi:hypothetical protein
MFTSEAVKAIRQLRSAKQTEARKLVAPNCVGGGVRMHEGARCSQQR